MPLFVTVTPGTTVTSSTTLDASTLNLLGTPSVDVTGTVDGGSITLGVQSVPLPSLYAQADQTIVGNGSAASASPVALTTTDLILTATTVNIKDGAVTAAKIATNTITANKLLQVNGTTPKILGRFTAGVGDYETNLSVGSNLTTTGNTLNALRPGVVFTNYTDATTYTLPAPVAGVPNRVGAVEIAVLTTSITPQTATSKVLVQFNISCEVAIQCGFILERVIGAAVQELGIPTSAGSRINGIRVQPNDEDTNSSQSIVPIIFVDSPTSTASVSYRVRVYGSAANVFNLNRTSSNIDSSGYTRATSQVILQEILP
jgi:hypothetical protein